MSLTGRGLEVALVAVGGALGTALRYGVAAAFGFSMLPATLTVNIVGAFALAFLFAKLATAHRQSDVRKQKLSLFLGVGLLGGFTTYSTFALDSASLYLSGEAKVALLYGAATLIVGGVASGLGFWLGSRPKFGPRPRQVTGRQA